MSTVDQELLDFLVCPETKQPVRRAGSDLLDLLNRAIDAGTVKTRDGTPVEERIEEGLGPRAEELGIACLDHDVEAVVGDPSETVVREQRMVQSRQPVHAEHPEHAGECGEEDGQLEHHRNERGDREQRLAGDEIEIGRAHV